MRSPLVQQWAGILAIAIGFALIRVPFGVIVFGFLTVLDAIGRNLEARRR